MSGPAGAWRELPGCFERVGVFSRGVARVPRLAALLRARELVSSPADGQARELDAVIGWGRKPSARAAEAYAERTGVPLVRIEDGFLRSIGLGDVAPPLSLVLDDQGIYYDAGSPSRLEALLEAAGPEDPLASGALVSRARALRERVVSARLSKYNHTPTTLPDSIRALGDDLIVVVDQTYGDLSVELGQSGPERFQEMLTAALDENPRARVLVKVHPDVIAGRKRGYLTLPPRADRLHVSSEPVNPILLLERASHVYVATSQLGFEAVMLGKRVSCFGVPFYAGYGLTEDRVTVPRRTRRRSVDELVAAALLLYPRYVHPTRGDPCEPEEVVEHLALQRRMFEENARRYVCFGFSRWKRPFVRKYLQSPGRRPVFVRSAAAAEKLGPGPDTTLLVWGPREPAGVAELARRSGAPVWRMEDGFLRSVRLGSDLSAPGSLVVDPRGIYYDPRTESELEHLLQHAELSPAELEAARELRALILELGVSKYNATSQALHLEVPPGQRVVLVPGQVEDDASVRFGSPEVSDNTALVRAVREARPDAFLVYKPHPDVVSGNRQGALTDAALALCDRVVAHASITSCLERADEVHTMTSLVGFEALLRGIPVVVHGQPFYAGWGLTEDRMPLARRARRRSLDELLALTLLRYPRYYSFEARAFCNAKDMVAELAQARAQARRPWLSRAPRLVRRVRGLMALVREIVDAR